MATSTPTKKKKAGIKVLVPITLPAEYVDGEIIPPKVYKVGHLYPTQFCDAKLQLLANCNDERVADKRTKKDREISHRRYGPHEWGWE